MRILFTLVLFFRFTIIFSQNIVINGDFEKYNFNNNYLKINAFPSITGWETKNTVDYYWNGNFNGIKNPHNLEKELNNRECYVGIHINPDYNIYDREYLVGELSQTIYSGEEFYISIRIYNSKKYKKMTQTVDIALIEYKDSTITSYISLKNNKKNDSWIEYTGIFLAKKNINYIAIGNFHISPKLKNHQHFKNAVYNTAYFYIDEIILEITGNQDTLIKSNPNSTYSPYTY